MSDTDGAGAGSGVETRVDMAVGTESNEQEPGEAGVLATSCVSATGWEEKCTLKCAVVAVSAVVDGLR